MTTLDDQIVAVRAFAATTERTAELLRCSYADAATFLMKFGSFMLLWNDQDFRAKLDAYTKALIQQTTPPMLAPTPIDRSVH